MSSPRPLVALSGGAGGGETALAVVRARLQRFLRKRWQRAEVIGDQAPDRAQRPLTTARWDVGGMREDLRTCGVEQLGDPAGVAVIDETGFLTKGTKSAGVKRQYGGAAGRVETSQRAGAVNARHTVAPAKAGSS